MANAYFDNLLYKITNGLLGVASQVNNLSVGVEGAFDKLPTETELKLGTARYGVDTGVADTYVVTLPYVPTLTDGFNFEFKAVNGNTGAATANVNATGAKAIVYPDGTAFTQPVFADNQIIKLAYDSTNDRYQLVSVHRDTLVGTDADTVDGLHANSTATANHLLSLDANKHLPADGFKFPATQVTSTDANTLDDYEEGFWTPSLEGSTTNPTQSYAIQYGTYLKIGSLIVLNFRIVMSNSGISGGTGGSVIRGIPFAGTFSEGRGGSLDGFASNWGTIAGAPTHLALNGINNLLNLRVYNNDSAKIGSLIASDAADITNSTTIAGTISFFNQSP